VLFDSDGDKPDNSGSREKHRKDNLAILKICGNSSTEPFPSEILWADNLVMWPADIEKAVMNDIGVDAWKSFREKADKYYGHTGGLRKNNLHIAMSIQLAWDDGRKTESLDKLCHKIIEFGENNS